jgi:hypothetical protein
MRRIIALLAMSALLVLALAVPAFAAPETVALCHNDNDPHEITVSTNAVRGLVYQQGDTLAPCGVPDDNGDGYD